MARRTTLQLIRLDEIETIAFSLEFPPDPESYEKEDLQFSFSVSNGSISSIIPQVHPLAESVQDDLSISLLSIEPALNDIGFEMMLFVENKSDDDFDFSIAPLINGYQTDRFTSSNVMPAGMNGTLRISVRDDIMARGIGIWILDNTVLSGNVLEAHGVNKIEEIIFYPQRSNEKLETNAVTLRLDDPAELEHGTYFSLGETLFPPQEASVVEKPVILAENDLFSIKMEKILFNQDNIILALELINKTNRFLKLSAENAAINGYETMDPDFEEHRWSQVNLPPDSTKLTSLRFTVSSENAGSIDSISVKFRSNLQISAAPSVIQFNPAVSPAGDLLIWKVPGQFQVDPAIDAAVMAEFDSSGNILMMSSAISSPENADKYSVWVSAGLTEEEAFNIRNGLALLVRKVSDTAVSLLSMTGIKRNEQNIPGAMFPGLILCTESTPEACVCMNYNSSDESIEADIIQNPILLLNSFDVLSVSGLHMRLDYISDSAEFTRFNFSENYSSLEDETVKMASIRDICYEFDPDHGALDRYIGDSPHYYNNNDLPLNGRPLEFTLRPVTSQDDLFILFSFVRKDQTGFSLPLIPFLNEALDESFPVFVRQGINTF